jgi:hypothetical protein
MKGKHMNMTFSCAVRVAMLALMMSGLAGAQQVSPSGSVVPNVISYAGILKDGYGNARNGSDTITFMIYADQSGGSPLWLETQNVTFDVSGRFAAQFGATSANPLPADLFTNVGERWLAFQLAGQAEQARVMLIAVPYALKARDAETLGGLPASSFLRSASGSQVTATHRDSSSAVSPGTITGVTAGTDLTGGGTSGNVTLNLDITKVPQLGTPNTFVGHQSVTGSITASGQLQGGAPGVLITDGAGQTMQIFSNPAPTGASAGTAQFIPNAGTLVGLEAYSIGLIDGTSGDFYCHHGLVAGGSGVCYFADVANNSGHIANSFSQAIQFDSVNSAGTDIFTSVRSNPQNSLEVSSGGSPGSAFGTIRQVPTTFANLPACGSAVEGTTSTVTDSSVNTWGSTIGGGGTNHILAYCDGSHWTVAAK